MRHPKDNTYCGKKLVVVLVKVVRGRRVSILLEVSSYRQRGKEIEKSYFGGYQ